MSDPVEELREIVASARRKRARIDRIPTREEIYRTIEGRRTEEPPQ